MMITLRNGKKVLKIFQSYLRKFKVWDVSYWEIMTISRLRRPGILWDVWIYGDVGLLLRFLVTSCPFPRSLAELI